jgi:hypothetical protein
LGQVKASAAAAPVRLPLPGLRLYGLAQGG